MAFAFLPIYRLIRVEEDAPVREASLAMAELTMQLTWWGTLTVVLIAVLLARLLPDVPERIGRRLGAWLERPRLPMFATGTGLVALGSAVVVWHLLYQGLYTSGDEMASIIHGRYMARGGLAGPIPTLPEGWLIPNTLMVDQGWVSHYPPSHIAAMAAFTLLGVPGLLGPVMIGVTAALVALTLPRILPTCPGAARAAALLTAVSPLLLFLAGGALSHLTAGAAIAVAAYAAVRARDGSARWALAVGAAIGVAVSARPLTGLLLGSALPLALWWPGVRARGLGWGLRRAATTVAGGMPFAVALGWYHERLFGAPTRWGYLAAFGDNHGLGFHPDPWGYAYGPVEALVFTSTDLIALGVQLLETPLPVTAAVGCLLLVGSRLPRGAGVLLAWAFLPIVGNALYWFHAPRMYFEAAPAWIALGVLAVVEGARAPSEAPAPWRRAAGSAVGWTAIVALGWAVVGGIPSRWSNAAWTEETLDRVTGPDMPDPGPALVFVHGFWTERVSATLQGAGGMRQDSVTAAMRRNATCELHAYARLREARVRHGRDVGPLPGLDFAFSAGAPRGIERRTLPGGGTIRVRGDVTLGPDCLRELHADRFGAVALAPLVWQGDLPGDEDGRSMFVRDLGPEKNEQIRAAFPERRSYVYGPFAEGSPPRVVPYDEAMEILWAPR